MTNLTKIRNFKELVKKLGGHHTKDAESMYYDCSGGESTMATECFIERYKGDVCFTQLASGEPSYESKENVGSNNCSGGYQCLFKIG